MTETPSTAGKAGDSALVAGPGQWRRLLHADTLGISASSICLIHCMMVPAAIAFSPVFLMPVLEAPWFHLLLVFLVLPTAVYALGRGYIEHGRPGVVALGGCGLCLILLGSLLPVFSGIENHAFELVVMTCGSLLLIGAHLRNRRLRVSLGGHLDHCTSHCTGRH